MASLVLRISYVSLSPRCGARFKSFPAVPRRRSLQRRTPLHT